MASYRLWFAPALAQIERDRRTLESLVATLAKPHARSQTAGATTLPVVQAIQAPLSAAPGTSRQPARSSRHPSGRARPAVAPKTCDARDPLCDSLELD